MRLQVDMHTQILGGPTAPVGLLRAAASHADDIGRLGYHDGYRVVVVDGTVGEQVIFCGAAVAERELLDVAIIGSATSNHGGPWRPNQTGMINRSQARHVVRCVATSAAGAA